jgi:hypothetical protein
MALHQGSPTGHQKSAFPKFQKSDVGDVFLRGVFARPTDTDLKRIAEEPDDMGRPRKDTRDLRSKWPVLNPTDQERAEITAFAKEVGLGVSAYLIACGLRRPPSPRQDWQRIMFRQARLQALLDEIAVAVTDQANPRDAGLALLALRRIEGKIDSLLPHPLTAWIEAEDGTC